MLIRLPASLQSFTLPRYGQATLDSVVKDSCAALRSGGVIAVPTETVYGVAASVTSNEGIQKIYAIKGRQKDKPIAICLSEVSQIEKWCKRTVAIELLNDLLPGPVTVVFERSEALNPALNPGVNLVGVRVPDYPLLRSLVTAFGQPLALTSANVSNTRSTLAIEVGPALLKLICAPAVKHAVTVCRSSKNCGPNLTWLLMGEGFWMLKQKTQEKVLLLSICPHQALFQSSGKDGMPIETHQLLGNTIIPKPVTCIRCIAGSHANLTTTIFWRYYVPPNPHHVLSNTDIHQHAC